MTKEYLESLTSRVGERVYVYGSIQRIRVYKYVVFWDVGDSENTIQVVVDPLKMPDWKKITIGSSIQLEATIQKRPNT